MSELTSPGRKIPISADIHAHTRHSHGQASTEEMFHAALGKGLKYFGFSEHSPRPEGYVYPRDYQEQLAAGFPDYVAEVGSMAERGRPLGMEVLLGLELDYIPGQEEYAASLCAAYPFDYVIGGLHFQGYWGFDFTADDWERLSLDACFSAYARYYDDLAAMCRTGLFQVAAHPDLIKLFTVSSFHAWLKTADAQAQVRTALAALKENNMVMEISSAGLRKPCHEIYPCPEIMEMARDLALPISFGSDAHCANTPAHAFDVLARYAASFGYTEHTIFVKRVARTLKFPV